MMLINFVFVFLNIYIVSAITILQQKIDKRRILKCVSEMPNKTLTWITPLKENYIDTYNKINDKNSVVFDTWLYETFDQQNVNGGYILDEEWQSFEIKVTTGNSEFIKFSKLQQPNVPFSFSLRISKEAHLYLCQNEEEPYLNQCYWVIISGWGGTKSVIRECVKESVPRYNVQYPNYECKTFLVEVEGNILDEQEWKHFNVAIEDEYLHIYKYGETKPFLKGKINQEFQYNTIYIKSRDTVGFWKLHNYYQYIKRNFNANSNFMRINGNQQVCFNMYVSFCAKCTLVLTITDKSGSNIYKRIIFKNKENEKWKKIHFNESLIYNDELRLGLDLQNSEVMSNENYVAVRSLKNCSEGPNIISLQINENIDANVACLDLLDLKDPIKFSEKNINNIYTNCKNNEFGENCIPCDKIYRTEFCDKTLICDVRGCYCAPGYYGKYCFKECRPGYFGRDCRETCGNCAGGKFCNNINGICTGKCEQFYTGEQCKELLIPVIKSPPMKTNECYNKCEIQFNLMEYTGTLQPNSYQIQVNEYYNKWTTLYRGNIDEKSFAVDKLQILTEYKFRIILCVENICNDGLEVPIYSLTTSCREMTREDLQIVPRSHEAEVIVTSNMDLCPISFYKYFMAGQSTRSPKRMKETNLLNNLQPYTTYDFNVLKNNSILFKITFQTEEDSPSKVKIIQKSVNKSCIYLQWSEPAYPNGILQYYNITYQFSTKVLGCKTVQHSIIKTEIIPILQREFSITNIQPYSQYDIQITAKNVKYLGEVESFEVDTLPNEEIDFDSYMVNYVTSTANTATFSFQKVCDKIKSPTYLSAEAKCFHDWCKTKSQQIHQGSEMNFLDKIFGLVPFTNYVVELYVKTKIEMKHQILVSSINITTKPDKPHKIEKVDIYSIYRTHQDNKYTIMFKWDESITPTGVLEKIIIQIDYTGYLYNFREDSQVIIPTKCVIWKKQYCGNLTVADRQIYYLNIKAKNEDVNVYSEIYTHTLDMNYWKKAPTSMPSLIKYIWNDDFTLNLTWEHPNYVKNKLEGFNIFVNTEKIYYEVIVENFTYSYKYIFGDDRHFVNEEFFLGVEAKSKSDTSAKKELKVKSPPPLPQIVGNPSIKKVQNHSITIRIPKIKTATKESIILVVVTQNIKNTEKNNVCNLTKFGITTNDRKRWVALEILNVNIDNTVEIGGGNLTFSKILNCYLDNSNLEVGNIYEFEIIYVNMRNNLTRFTKKQLKSSTVAVMEQTKEFSTLATCIIIFAILLIGILGGIYYFKKRNIKLPPFIVTSIPISTDSALEPLPANQAVAESNENEINLNEFSCYTKVVDIANLENYIRKSIKTGELDKEHASLKKRDDISCSYGKKVENKSKNRYANIIPYDHNRVILNKINNDPFSDYINANYINGINCANAYIAAQAPKSNTLNDFWRMIWEQNVENIVMLTSIYEGTKKKSEKYWPELGEELKFAGISVELISLDVYPDFQSRMLLVKFDGMKRNINHLYYTNWPDHDVPLYPYSLVQFVGKILSIPEGKAPILVHCSAGVGRTGTIILIDLCLRMVDKHGVIDVFYHQKQLREQRPNMVDTAQQYKFAHLVLLECLLAPKTEIECNENFEATIENIDIQAQIEYIESSAWYENVLVKKSKVDIVIDPDKNRFQDIVPENYGIIYLSPTTDSASSSYINAVTVDNFMLQNQFVATQQPMPQTLQDFWRLIYEYDIEVIISLQEIDLKDPTCCEFWPTAVSEKIMMQDHLQKNLVLTYIKSETFTGYELITLNMKYKKESRTIIVIALKNWKYGEDCPANSNVFLKICSEMHSIVSNSNKIVVTCKDGASGCGLYIAMCFLLEKIKYEQICDVCHTVRIIRRSRKQFIPNEVQFCYLYEIAKLYMKEFEIYSNFSK